MFTVVLAGFLMTALLSLLNISPPGAAAQFTAVCVSQ